MSQFDPLRLLTCESAHQLDADQHRKSLFR
jgi:hypothetical protein